MMGDTPSETVELLMKKRAIGSIEVSALGLGCMGMTWAYGTADETESRKTLDLAYELGIDFFDSAEVYGPHTNEELLARHFAGRMHKIKIATKFGFVVGEGANIASSRGLDSSPANVRRACEGSLRRLKVETIDLYYQHRVDPRVPIEETVGAMAELVKEGKVRELGLSEASVATLRRACKVHPIAALQSEYSLWERDVEEELLPACRELGVTFVAYSPLGRGFLAGKSGAPESGDFRASLPRFTEENRSANERFLRAIDTVVAKYDATRARVALAWLLAKDVVAIPGARRTDHLRDNAGAATLELSEEEMRFLDEECGVGSASGARYGENSAKWIDR
jgi:aryl-alcohol dehydrogenase-like predicted oxidoreductase